MDVQIRQCEIMDAKAIYELNVREMGYDYPMDKTEEKIKQLIKSDRDKIFVALIDHIVVGYVHANDYDVIYALHLKNIMGIAVSSAFMKKGIGRALLSTIEDWARKDGAGGVRLVSGMARTGAHEFYRHCGYNGNKQQLNSSCRPCLHLSFCMFSIFLTTSPFSIKIVHAKSPQI